MKAMLRALGWLADSNLLRNRDELADRVNRQLTKQAESLTRQAALLLDRAGTVTERLDAIQSDVTRRFAPPPPPPKPSRGRTVLLLFAGVGAGYLAAYFLDPEQGRGRRAEVARQLGGLGTEANRMAQRTTILATDKAAGIKSRVLARTGSTEADDLTLLDRVESEGSRDPAIPKGDGNVPGTPAPNTAPSRAVTGNGGASYP
jgi:hypothetical protein